MSKYDPAAHGLPDVIAGYAILAVVIDSDYQPCSSLDTRTLVVQVLEPDLREYLRSSDTHKTLAEAIIELDPSGNTRLMVVGPGVTHEQVWADYAALEENVRGWGCAISIPPGFREIVTLTPTSQMGVSAAPTPKGR